MLSGQYLFSLPYVNFFCIHFHFHQSDQSLFQKGVPTQQRLAVLLDTKIFDRVRKEKEEVSDGDGNRGGDGDRGRVCVYFDENQNKM